MSTLLGGHVLSQKKVNGLDEEKHKPYHPRPLPIWKRKHRRWVYMSGMLAVKRERNGGQRNGVLKSYLVDGMLTGAIRKRYHEIKDEWCGVPEVFDRPDILEVTTSASSQYFAE